mgnify:CR=1 FL=1
MQLQSYVHYPSGRRSLMTTESILVPADVKPLVELISGLNRLPRVQSSEANHMMTIDQQKTFQITPAVIAKLYALPESTPPSSNIQGIAAFNNETHIHYCKTCDNRTDFSYVELPYACKLMFQELMTMNIAPRIMT